MEVLLYLERKFIETFRHQVMSVFGPEVIVHGPNQHYKLFLSHLLLLELAHPHHGTLQRFVVGLNKTVFTLITPPLILTSLDF